MHGLFVVKPGLRLPDSQLIAWLCHSETDERLALVMASGLTVGTEAPLPPELHPGTVEHFRNHHSYFLFLVATELETGQAGVWYRALYPVGTDTPHFFRPLHTADSKGWLDPVADGQPRFKRIRHNRRSTDAP